MFKKIILILLLLWINLFTINFNAFAAIPEVNCIWLPWCVDSEIKTPWAPDNFDNNLGLEVIVNIIWELIQFVAVFAVLALIISGIMYLLSWWEEEKTKKAKTWITWSLVWVVVSISAWGLINILNNLTIS